MIPILICGAPFRRYGSRNSIWPIPTVVAKLADEAGLPGKKLVERSASDDISAAYEQNRQDAIAADVFGSPVYVLDGEVFWGQDRIELLADALKSGRKAYSSKNEA